MLIGYARVSTDDQILDLQTTALKAAGCQKIISDTISGAKADRPGLTQVMTTLRTGDTLVVWRLDRLGRSLKSLIETIEQLDRDGIQFKSLTESIDTSTPNGKLIFHLFGAFAEFERNLIRERTNAGLAAARSRGRMGGRKKALSPKQQAMAVEMYHSKKYLISNILETFGISKPALYRYIRAAEEDEKNGTPKINTEKATVNDLDSDSLPNNLPTLSADIQDYKVSAEWEAGFLDGQKMGGSAQLLNAILDDDWASIEAELHKMSDLEQKRIFPIAARLITSIKSRRQSRQ